MNPLVGLLLLLTICFSCSKEDDYEPHLKGNIVGFAMLTDQYGNLLNDHSGINVYVEPITIFNAKTDSRGRFEIRGVPTGTYNLLFEKSGFGSMKYPEVQHLGGQATVLGIPYDIRIFLHENITAQTNITMEGNFISVSSTGNGDCLYVRLFFSTSDGFLIEDSRYAYNEPLRYGPAYFDLSMLPFESGTKIYCRSSLFTSGLTFDYNLNLMGSLRSIDTYTDSDGNTVYPNLTKESDQYAFIIP